MAVSLKNYIDVGRLLKIGIFLLLFLLLTGNLVTLSYGIESLNLIRVFSGDEASAVNRVLRNLEHNDLNPRGFYNYGYVYHTAGFYLLKTLGHFGFKVDAMLVTLVFRFLSLFFYALAGFFLYKIFTRCLGGEKVLGLISALVLLSTPKLSYWSTLTHPDSLQMLLVILAVYIVFSKHNTLHLFLGSAAAGLAFGTKYSGAFILPFLFFPYLFGFSNTSPKNMKAWMKPMAVVLIAMLIFLSAWLLTNPYVLSNFDEFQKDFSFERGHVSRGHGKAEETNPFLWLVLLMEELGFLYNIVLAGIGMVMVSLLIINRKYGFQKLINESVNINILTLILYAGVAFIYLMLTVNMRRPRYFFHILPFIIIIGIYGCQKLGSLFSKKWVTHAIAAVLLVLVSFQTMNVIRQVSTATTKYDHEYIKAGEFLDESENIDVKILADSYSYVPPKFKSVRFIWGIDEEKIKKYEPDIIVLNVQVTGKRAWKKSDSLFKDLVFRKGSLDNWEKSYRCLMKLFSPGSDWVNIYETDNMVILKK